MPTWRARHSCWPIALLIRSSVGEHRERAYRYVALFGEARGSEAEASLIPT